MVMMMMMMTPYLLCASRRTQETMRYQVENRGFVSCTQVLMDCLVKFKRTEKKQWSIKTLILVGSVRSCWLFAMIKHSWANLGSLMTKMVILLPLLSLLLHIYDVSPLSSSLAITRLANEKHTHRIAPPNFRRPNPNRWSLKIARLHLGGCRIGHLWLHMIVGCVGWIIYEGLFMGY